MKTNQKWMLCFIVTLLFLGNRPALATDTTMDPVALIGQHLQLDSRIHATGVQINRKGDTILISGSVMSLAEKQLVEETVERTWGKNYSAKDLKVIPPSVPDYEIQRNIATAIPAHCQVEIHDLGIEVKDGNVTLKGTTNALHHQTIAAYVASNTKGVKSVTNNIRVVGKRQSDQLLLENIRSILNPYVKENGIQVDITVSEGKVTLRGEVTSYDQSRYIRQTAENVRGVVSVEDKMRRESRTWGRNGGGRY